MASKTAAMLSAVALLFASWVSAQCPNEVAVYHPTLRSMTVNSSWFIVPVPSTAAQKALDDFYGIGKVSLAPVPTTDTTLFPSGFPSSDHPVLVSSGFDDDIRQSVLQIDGALLVGSVYVPYVRRAGASANSILTAPLNNYLVGENGNAISALVPSTVSTLIEGIFVRLGMNVPADAAYQLNSNGVLSNKVAWDLLPNPITGPGVYPEVLDFQYEAADSFTTVTAKLFKVVLNQPVILYGAYFVAGQCQRMQYYFNNSTGAMLPRFGNVTLGPAADGLVVQLTGTLQQASPDGSGFYSGLQGFSACAQNLNYNVESCDSAAMNVDPTSL
ncbi:hypothetical protein EJ03DRAFT_324129 [Teratosphaeria nubilosa]|uniref:Uncharacterized protein n=1 Tax=Teratosphaeria nubilosa TaxID=161662 RepID=A0A6G1LJP2_9PEZI|nr:hypothetical protein EJ03DRAFT_324129 [Teratosphaeria nubilosa]